MGDAFDLYEAGILDEMGEYTGNDGQYYQRTKRRIDKSKLTPKNKRYGVVMFVHNHFTGKAQMPSAKEVVKKYGKHLGLETTSFDDLCVFISDHFTLFKDWVNNKKYNQ